MKHISVWNNITKTNSKMEYHNCLPLPEELENIVMEKKEELEKRDAVRDALEKRKIQQEKYKIQQQSVRKYMLRFYETEDDIESGNFNEYEDWDGVQELMNMKEILEIINDPYSDLHHCAKFEIIQNA